MPQKIDRLVFGNRAGPTRKAATWFILVIVVPKFDAGFLHHVVGVIQIRDDNQEVVLVTNEGKLIRIPMSDVRVIGRNTQGVRCINLRDGDELVAAAKVPNDDPET